MIAERIQYVLLDAEGREVERHHQDDESDTVWGSTIEALLDYASDRVGDMGLNDFLSEIQREGSEFFEGRVIVRAIRPHALNTTG